MNPMVSSIASATAVADWEDAQIALMLRVKQGDVTAFDELVGNHRGKVVAIVSKMLNCRAEAEDIAQQVFVQVWKSACRYEPQAKFETWLNTITRNLVFNEKRRQQRKPTVSMDESVMDYFDRQNDNGSPHLSPNEIALYLELENTINVAISNLPETQRAVLRFRIFEAMSYHEIAAQLDLTVPTVKSQLFRARCQLRGQLSHYIEADS